MFSGGVRVQRDSHDNLCLEDEAKVVRRTIVEALWRAGGGHYGGSLSIVDVLLVLYRRQLKIDVARSDHPMRDRLILSKGHAAIALYTILERIGVIRSTLWEFGELNSALTGHPDMTQLPGVDFSTGSLGQGLSVGLGMALARPKSTIWVVLGDGECQEGQIWEAAMLASRLGLSNLKAVVDCNGYQECGQRYEENTAVEHPVQELSDRWGAFGWHVVECAGNDLRDVEATAQVVKEHHGSPSIILARTIKGFGSRLIESDPYRFHCTSVTGEEHTKIIGAFQ